MYNFKLDLIAPVDTSNPALMHQFLHSLVDQLTQRMQDLQNLAATVEQLRKEIEESSKEAK